MSPRRYPASATKAQRRSSAWTGRSRGSCRVDARGGGLARRVGCAALGTVAVLWALPPLPTRPSAPEPLHNSVKGGPCRRIALPAGLHQLNILWPAREGAPGQIPGGGDPQAAAGWVRLHLGDDLQRGRQGGGMRGQGAVTFHRMGGKAGGGGCAMAARHPRPGGCWPVRRACEPRCWARWAHSRAWPAWKGLALSPKGSVQVAISHNTEGGAGWGGGCGQRRERNQCACLQPRPLLQPPSSRCCQVCKPADAALRTGA